jgi:mRNA interferase YafQ
MRDILTTEKYKRDVRRLHKKHYDLSKLTDIVKTLQQHGTVPASHNPHKLHGKWSNYVECHIAQDWLLIYKVNADTVSLYRTGTHDDLF